MKSRGAPVWSLFLLLLVLPACGRQLVEFPAGDAGGRVDAGHDAVLDAPRTDTGTPDVPAGDAPRLDLAADLPADLAAGDAPRIDAPIDVRIDAPTVDVPIDVPGVDAPIEAPGIDASADAFDVRPDTAGVEVSDASDARFDLGDANGAPMVISTDPVSLAMNVSTRKIITATFTKPMNAATINMTTFVLTQGGTMIPGTVSYSATGTIATFLPNNDLAVNTIYIATITTGVTDSAGNPMLFPYAWTFTTGTCGLMTVVLGNATGYAVLAGMTVTNTGGTRVTGDLGVSPGTAVTGFPPGVLIGTAHAADGASAAAQASLGTAYGSAAARIDCAHPLTGEIGGQTWTPGLYKATGAITISAGEVVLDAEGDPNAVFIFQMTTTLTVATGRQVLLVNGAQPSMIFWQVGTSATLGSSSAVQGTIMAGASISMGTNASLVGRALAINGAVTLDTNDVTLP